MLGRQSVGVGWDGGGGNSNHAMLRLAEVQLRLCERGAGRSYRPKYYLGSI